MNGLYPEELQTHEGIVQWLEAAFEPGEHVGVCPANEDFEPVGGITMERNKLIEKLRSRKGKKHGGQLSDVWTTKRGLYVRVNPMTSRKA